MKPIKDAKERSRPVRLTQSPRMFVGVLSMSKEETVSACGRE